MVFAMPVTVPVKAGLAKERLGLVATSLASAFDSTAVWRAVVAAKLLMKNGSFPTALARAYRVFSVAGARRTIELW